MAAVSWTKQKRSKGVCIETVVLFLLYWRQPDFQTTVKACNERSQRSLQVAEMNFLWL